MGKWTAQVKLICEKEAGVGSTGGYSSVNEVIQAAIPKVFDFDFPIYDESYRNVLCGKILKHYYMREIGAETVGQWKLWLDMRLNEIMPYYNQLYKSAMLEFNPMYDVDITTRHSRKNDGKTDVAGLEGVEDKRKRDTEYSDNSTTQNSGNRFDKDHNETKTDNDVTRWDMYSDTPQGTLSNVENLAYLTTARKNTDESDTSVTGDSATNSEYADLSVVGRKTDGHDREEGTRATNRTENTVASSTEEYIQTVKGKNGGASYAKMLVEFRKTFLNIDKMIIDDLSDLFFGLW